MKKETIQKEEHTCKNCKYYLQHYSKDDIGFRKVDCGYCTNKNNEKMKAIFCEFWEDVVIKEKKGK